MCINIHDLCVPFIYCAQTELLKAPYIMSNTEDAPIVKTEESIEQSNDTQHEMFENVWVKVEMVEVDTEFQKPDEEMEVKSYSKRKTSKPKKITREMKCNDCDYTTIYKNCFQLHVLGHTNFKPFSCDTCNYVTKYPTSLHRHMLTQHENKSPEKVKGLPLLNCQYCSYTTYYKWNLSAHNRKHKSEKEYQCDKCNYRTAYRNNYTKHAKVHNKKESLYKCDKCPFTTKFEGHITRHLAKIHNEMSDTANKCDLCDFSTHVKWRLNIHKQRSKQNEILKCAYCSFETFFMCESKKHKVLHYNEIYVQKNVIHKEEISNSRQIDSNSTNVTIDTENKTAHEINHHYIIDAAKHVDWNSIKVLESNDKEKPFQCIMCAFTAKFKASVQRHFQRHHTGSQNRPYKCSNCDFSTKTKDQIALHNKRSYSESTITCPSCNFFTNFKCQYVMHQKCHYQNKCPQCNYSCKSKYDITKHFTTVHLGNGLKCRFCDFQASRTESLLCHETIHTGQKPFKCSHCSYTSVRKSLLTNHIKRYHSDVKSETVLIDNSKIESLRVKPEELQNQDDSTEFFDCGNVL